MKKNATSPRPISENQSVGTPWEFIEAVERYRGPLHCDLAATQENKKAPLWIGPDWEDCPEHLGRSFFRESLPSPPAGSYNWLNPPFADIAPWVQRVVEEEQPTLILVPASVGSVWYGEWVEGYMSVSFLRPRIKFEGHTAAYPKDLMLLTYNPSFLSTGLLSLVPQQWRWK